MHGEDIICIASIDWDFNWQGHQEIMARLVKMGNRVLFIENTGIRFPRLKDLPRLWLRLRVWSRSTYGIREVSPNLFVYSPLSLPFPYSRCACWINRLLIMAFLAPWFRTMRFQNPIVWTFLPTRLALTLIKAFRPKLLIYYCIADFEALQTNARKVRRYERQLARMADLVFAQGERLRKRCAEWNSRVSIFPFGVDVELFETAARSEPAELLRLPRPIVGYVGGLHRHVDVSLIGQLAELRPDWSVVLIGPRQETFSELSRVENVHLLGPRSHQEVPSYIKQFDVCVIPYCLNAYTETVYPTKLNEYLVMGKPVVSTPLPEVKAFNQRHQDIVRIARDPEAFERTICDLLEKNGEWNQRSRDIAYQYSWEVTTQKMTGLIQSALEEKKSALELGWQTTLMTSIRQLLVRTALALFFVGFFYWLVFHTPALWLVARPLKKVDAVAAVQAIAVVAGGAGESGQAGQGYQERVKFAVDLFGKRIAENLVFSSGNVYVFQETAVMKALAVSMGVPAAAIVLEAKAGSTYENVKFIAEILRAKGWTSIAVVSSPYHMRRIALVFRKIAPDISVLCAPIPSSEFYGNEGEVRLRHIRGILREYVAIAYYWWNGWI